MLALLHLLSFSLQINRMFAAAHVKHLLDTRMPPASSTRFYGDVSAYVGVVTSAQQVPELAILSMESSRMHIFLHDTARIRRCLWDGAVTYDDKKEIVKHMMLWLNATDFGCTARIHNYEDGCVFGDVLQEMGRIDPPH